MNLNICGITQSPTLAITETSKHLENEGHTIYRMGLGQSPFTVPVPVVEALRINRFRLMRTSLKILVIIIALLFSRQYIK